MIKFFGRLSSILGALILVSCATTNQYPADLSGQDAEASVPANYVDYASETEKFQQINVSIPQNSQNSFNAILYLHDAALTAGDTSRQLSVFREDHVVAAMPYRFPTETIHVKDEVGELDEVLIQIRNLVAEHAITINKVILIGQTTDGQLSIYFYPSE
jgi:hypothetical protein